jgi:signal transduction histidine kinase
MKTQAKIIVVLSIICIAIVVLVSAATYYFVNEYSYGDFYKRLETRERIFTRYQLYRDSSSTSGLITLKNQYLEKLEGETEYIIPLTPGLTARAIAEKYKLPASFITALMTKGKARGKKESLFFVGSNNQHEGKQYLIVISAENYYATHHLLFLRNILVGIVVVVILLIILFSYYFSNHIFDPIKEITNKVKLISTENIHLRLDPNNNANNREINNLIHTFNDLLNRIETAFETQKNFISNASHELGTPLTSIIGEADVALLKERTKEEYQQALKNILKQGERLDKITKSLLFLAQTGYKGNAIRFEQLRIDEVIWETKQLIDQLNPSNNINIDLSLLPEDPNKLKLSGNKQLLQLAFANILNNACKYSTNKPVIVYLASSDTNIVVTIKDQGIGIPEADISYIYDPFYRASNTQKFEGYGIGLPLARNVVILHKGALNVSSFVQEGTTVQIKLPINKF